MAYLSLTVRPKVDTQPNDLVDGGVGALVQERGGECGHGQEGEAGLEAAVQAGPREEAERPLEREQDEAEDEVDGLQDGDRLDGRVQRLGEGVPEDLGPEVALDRGGDLVCLVYVS